MKAVRGTLARVGVVKVALFVLAVVALSASGCAQNEQPNSARSPTQSTSQPTTAASQQSATGYLDIKEWGIKLPLSNGIKDAYYTPNIPGGSGVDGQPNQMLVGFKSLDSSGCAVADSAAPVLLFRTSPSQVDPVSGDVVSKDYPGMTIGAYFYGFGLTKSETCNSEATFQSLDAALKTAVKGIVLDTSH